MGSDLGEQVLFILQNNLGNWGPSISTRGVPCAVGDVDVHVKLSVFFLSLSLSVLKGSEIN